ncbi:class I histocompatibility antigen, F10 alpha chain-like isoform X1 [Hemicordylus capensis]|uniref:class I histocompatibility antigen, F10 alpha chain-like isoform X1 n=1 Tax=Hemicordylus capensis TaxID=884348 RepID=UPI002302B156|nr:class I histocompatibility antigen, F10 alpha chain-like isoform X1 [Hemicordylus capensis]
MGLPLWSLLSPGAALALLSLEVCLGSSSHSLRFFYTGVYDPNRELPHFGAVGYVNDHLFVHYDISTRKALPRVPWAEAVEKEDALYWEKNAENFRNAELRFRGSLVRLQLRYNQSGGFHTLQRMFGCELSEDGSRRGHYQCAYDGRDFVSFDKETLTWTAAEVAAQFTKTKRDANIAYSQYWKRYLEEECISWLQKHLDYGKKTLLRTEPPTVKVTRQAGYDALETLTCRAHGFYPKEINATWRKDGEPWEQDTFRGGIAPNPDQTYHTWLSIKIDPKDRDHYQCHVQHASLPEPAIFAWEEPASMWLIVGASLGSMTAVLLLAGVLLYVRKWHKGYSTTSTSERGCNISTRA